MEDLCRFVADGSPGLRLGAARGRRRHGKSFLLEHLCRAMDGVYTLALRQSRAMALTRFADGVSHAVGYRLGRFDDWPAALDTVIDALSGARRERPVLIVIDEFPYLAAGSPEVPSAIQALYDQRGTGNARPRSSRERHNRALITRRGSSRLISRRRNRGSMTVTSE